MDGLVSASILALLALPGFLIAVFTIVLFSTSVFHILPPTSVLDPGLSPWSQPALLVLPVVALVLGCLPYLTQMVRGTMVEALDSEYVTWARLNGVPERRIVWWHSLRNVAAPSLQVAASTLIYLVGGIVTVETVFSYPGLGLSLVSAVSNRDIPVVQAITMLIAAATLFLYVIADVAGILLTPKVRTSL
jgi:peptide/nickel transport system permease protein